MSNIEWLKLLTDLLADESSHFFWAVCMGLAVSYLILIMLSAWGFLVTQLTRQPLPMVAVYGMVFICILAGFAGMYLSHLALDGLSVWWSTPLGPSLQLELAPIY